MVILITPGLLSRIQVNPVCSFSFVCLFQNPNTVYFQLVFVLISQKSKKPSSIG